MSVRDNQIKKSIEYSRKLLSKNSTDFQHFAFIFKKNKLLSIGQNDPTSTNAKSTKLAKRFGAKKPLIYPYIHAEIDAISKLWGKLYIDKIFTLVSIRLNRHGELRISKPCKDCQIVLKGLCIPVIFYDGKSFYDTKFNTDI